MFTNVLCNLCTICRSPIGNSFIISYVDKDLFDKLEVELKNFIVGQSGQCDSNKEDRSIILDFMGNVITLVKKKND